MGNNNENSNDKLDALKNFENNLNLENNSIKLFDEKNSETVSKIEEKESKDTIDSFSLEQEQNDIWQKIVNDIKRIG